MNTLQDFLEDYYTGEPEEVALGHLEEMLRDLDMLGAFEGGAYSADEMMDNIRRKR